MAHARRSPQHRAPSSSISSPSTNRRNTLRRAHPRFPGLASSQSVSSPLVNRPVLVPLQPNLRRLPCRILAQKDLDQLMRDSGHVIQVGSKRKRVVSSNENAHTHGRPTRGSGRLKRLRSDAPAATRYYHPSTSESESEISGMDVDAPTARSSSGDEEQEEQEVEADENESENEDESSDDYLIHTASSTHLQRLRKSELVRLYSLTGLADDPELLTKSEIVHAIVTARDDVASLPPSSPIGRGDAASSDYTSDEGNFAGDEETDAAGPRRGPSTSPLKRHVTAHDVGKTTLRPLKNRSVSMGNLLGNGQPPQPFKRKVSTRSDVDATELMTSRRRSSTRSSPTASATTSTSTQSPPATRLRSRKASTAVPDPTTPTSIASKGKAKAKAKQVEFSSEVEVRLQTPSKRSSKDRGQATAPGSESDLTELEELEKSLALQPSPRRLRSKDRVLEQRKAKEDPDATPMAPSKRATRGSSKECEEEAAELHGRHVRITPMRKAKGKIGSLKDSGLELDEGGNNQSEEDEEEPGETEEEDEVDELVSSASISPQPESKGSRTPLRRRLRPRRNRRKPLPDGDDENEGDDEEEEEQMVEEEVEEEGEEQEQEEDGSQADEDDEDTIAVEPRKLRNGKIVGEEEDVQMEIDEDDVDEEEEEAEEAGGEDGAEDGEDGEEAEEDEGGDAEGIDVDADGETDEDEVMEDDVDLTIATAKSLVRLRRDDLVRLCETRDLDPVGTKPQLAEALLQWRDRQGNDFSSPSSAGTVRPSSNRRRRKTKYHSSSTNSTVPVLLRSEQVHTDEPRTPVPGKEKENEELELDLESLGLEDREIPPEKITKLEKIGSGGFKDVFIGKFKGRRIAISEFRGQLSAMDIKELKLLGAFNHPNIVRFLGVSIPENTKETPVMIVSELCSNGDLFDYIRNVNAPTVRRVLNMMLDIARGLEYLHTRKPSIIHRDCKSSNILITAKGTAKIADFGLAKVKQSTRSMVRSLVGTVNWQAPELWHAHPKYNHKVDVFSCAMVYWEMLQWQLANKKFPWEGMNEHAIYEIVGSKRQRPTITGLRKQWCCEIVDLIEHMWAQEHQDRPTMTEVVEALEKLVSKY